MKHILTTTMIVLFAISPFISNAQQPDLFAADSTNKTQTKITIATFKNTRLINGHSVETLGAGIMDFRIHHRFGFLNQGLYDFFGLDNATTFLGFDYGITNRLTVGISRSGYLKQMEGFAKYRLLRQSTGKVNMPVSVTFQASVINKTADITSSVTNLKYNSSEKTAYTYQFLIARKLSEGASLQIMPTLVHYNLAPNTTSSNDYYSLGFGGRQKISKRISINAEYYYQFNKIDNTYFNSLAVGVDIETGGHVFQLHFTNSTGMTEPTFIHETTGDWGKGEVHFGFNVSRVFVIKKPKEFRN
ncbi:MAG: hypothetical protein C0459_10085 [Chitinophaga sp.]|jgi:Membrane bound beta barrel domain (DUF5777)|nr:hypothetical protein [Chitinophaga sp.]